VKHGGVDVKGSESQLPSTTEKRSMREEDQTCAEQTKHRRERGTGRIWPRGSGIWWIQYYVNGFQKRESSNSTKEEVAEKLLGKRLAEIEAGVSVGSVSQRLRYEHLRDTLYDDYRSNRRRWLRLGKNGKPYIGGVSHLDDFFARQRAMTITTMRIRQFIAKRQAGGASNGTINRELALLRRMLNLALQDGTLKISPHFPMLKEAPPRKGFLEHTDFQKLRHELPEHLRALATMGYYTGMRVSEMLRIRWDSVDFQGREIRLNPGETKNDEPRTVPLISELLEMLRIERERSPNAEFVFTRAGNPIGSFYKAWKSACKRAELDGLLFHDFRRTGVRNLVRAGVPERVAMTISGHKTRAVFERYNIVSGRDLKEAAGKLESYLAEQSEKQSIPSAGTNRHNSGTNEPSGSVQPKQAHLN
jgi:integrase